MLEQVREIPYNYTSYSDKEIILRFLGEESWNELNILRQQRKTGRSARMLFEMLGDVWVIERNMYLKSDMLKHPTRLRRMRQRHDDRLKHILSSASDNELALKITERTKAMLQKFYDWFVQEPRRRSKVKRALAHHTHKNNIHFDAYTLSHHATDATDWRQEHPFCVITPDNACEIAKLVPSIQKLGLHVIPRGGGTGLNGGSVPLHNNAVMINIEKLDHIGEVKLQNIDDKEVPTISAQAGAVTGRVMEASQPHIFATDPTSLWACSIGGNIATNAGGKHAVIWGTCLDNLLSWKMVTADGTFLLVERLHHNIGKIPVDEHIEFRLTRFQQDGITIIDEPSILRISGTEFRQKGLGKDVTRKALHGLPGIQKEGTDGLTVEATFILHQAYAHTRTVCCEFFGQKLDDATQAMVNIKTDVDATDQVYLEGLEHFDSKYVKAIEYRSKSTRSEAPRVVLLIDVSGDDEKAVAEACAHICKLTSQGNGEGFVAVQAQDRKTFWADRSRMAAIARHTRAFKLNEDVVIPLDRLSEYNDFIERCNIEYSLQNKLNVLQNIHDFLIQKNEQADTYLLPKLQQAQELIQLTQVRWQSYLDGLDLPANTFGQHHAIDTLFNLMQYGGLPISWKKEVKTPLMAMFGGYAELQQGLIDAHQKVLSSRIVIATHMHAGDGNVHTNIPVNSNDYLMMQAAHHAVERVMEKAVELGGVISGEHGIGITKLAYMKPEYLDDMQTYLNKVDPNKLFNPDKLVPNTDLRFTYTPSFNLLEMESMILEAADITELAEDISPCLRCGKCKPVCNTHFPRASMLYSPRNKIQATGAMIEALLYESQTGSGISLDQFEGMQEVADHCTICHKCESPCPVNIDFGDVTEKMRAILKKKGKSGFRPGAKLAMAFLLLKQPNAISLMRKAMIDVGYRAHRLLHRVAKKTGLVKPISAAKRNLDGIEAQVINFVERPLPIPPSQTTRSMLGIDGRDKNSIPILRDPTRAKNKAVFYFPGCGSERLFSQVGLATQAALYDLGLNVVLPPEYLCCGYPSTASGDHERGQQISYDNRILFHRLKNALSYMDFDAVVVSCGTCFDQLDKYELEKVFPDAPLIDIHEYLIQQGASSLESVEGLQYMYHEPCHTPLKQYGSQNVVEELLKADAVESAQCCGEAGTLAVSSPIISGKIRARKEEDIAKKRATIPQKKVKILTSCPSCLQGLGRLEESSDVEADYIVVEWMRRQHGEDWQEQFISKVKTGGIERVLM
ncbi:MAG: DUF3683 domain-containing protein [Mariprofundaceae bacterium]|nr:DUF3683 domain-containing protein [Mariprofundaceae bacterium]